MPIRRFICCRSSLPCWYHHGYIDTCFSYLTNLLRILEICIKSAIPITFICKTRIQAHLLDVWFEIAYWHWPYIIRHFRHCYADTFFTQWWNNILAPWIYWYHLSVFLSLSHKLNRYLQMWIQISTTAIAKIIIIDADPTGSIEGKNCSICVCATDNWKIIKPHRIIASNMNLTVDFKIDF